MTLEVQFAPVLQEVARRFSPDAPAMADHPAKWAYAMREAIDGVRPDWIVTHFDTELEANAAEPALRAGTDSMDLDFREDPSVVAALACAETLAGLYPGRAIAASITGPATVCEAVITAGASSDESRDDLMLDCGDALARLINEFADRGANRLIVWETPGAIGDLNPDVAAGAHGPLLRRLELLGLPSLLCGFPGSPPQGYGAYASSAEEDGPQNAGAALLDRGAFDPETGLDGFKLYEAAKSTAGNGGVILTQGALSSGTDLAALREAVSSP